MSQPENPSFFGISIFASVVFFKLEAEFYDLEDSVLRSMFEVGKDGIEAGTNLVPNSVPRPLARISVTVVALSLALFVLKSFLSTAFFVLCTMGLVYFIFLAVNKGDPPGGGGGGGNKDYTSTEDSLEEARRIMDKYK
ncbi:hypothetical protein QQ045_005755 [Rhodiola kirilowii]